MTENIISEGDQLEESVDLYERPSVYLLPRQRLFAVEYPGYIKNVHKVISTLGEKRGLLKAVNKGLAELRYRHNDPFCHPINGDVVPTANFLLKVTRRRKKSSGKQEGNATSKIKNTNQNFTFEVVGIINKTCRFRGMSDAQYVPNPYDSIPNLRRQLGKFDVEGMRKFTFQQSEDYTKPTLLPPPSLARIEIPMEYKYQQNVSVIKVMIRPNETNVSDECAVSQTHKSTLEKKIHRLDEGPPPEVLNYVELLPKEPIEKLKKMFEERPVWTRLALLNTLPKTYKKLIRKLLPLVAYWMVGGPWRDCWIRYGYDPRNDQTSRIYQLLDVRNTRRPLRLERAKRMLNGQPSVLSEHSRTDSQPETVTYGMEIGGEDASFKDISLIKISELHCRLTDRDSHIFSGLTKTRDVAVFQLCDVTDPLLQRLIGSSENFVEVCDELNGFYTSNAMKKMRKILRRKFEALDENEILSEESFKDILERHASDNEEIPDESGVEDENASATGETTPADPISNRIVELMRNLQNQQQLQDATASRPTELLYRVEDLEDYADIFGPDELLLFLLRNKAWVGFRPQREAKTLYKKKTKAKYYTMD
ncbi:1019_t:CDS:10 [Paraglomus occultum]|uniref:1019_t:CDS:1 n=1 Tax=Paraglomus occultum TaxID=144539 RepID=A0A9N8YSX6_9GLOM|nr:1019_t:CDS:10 [Paraglomus occultum]